MKQDKFELVKLLRENVPDELLAEQDTVFGTPDAADGGGVYFAIRSETISRFWIMDQMDINLPSYLKTFKFQINESIDLINN